MNPSKSGAGDKVLQNVRMIVLVAVRDELGVIGMRRKRATIGSAH